MKKAALCLLLASFLLLEPSLAVAQDDTQPPEGEAKVRVVPHKALYRVALEKAKQGVGIHDITGTMIFDMADGCDGWIVHQHMQMQFSYPEGDRSEVASSIVTWEAKDAKSFIFNVKRVVDGKEDEAYKGRTSTSEMGGVAHYMQPKEKEDIILPEGTVFPIAHTTMILEKAAVGEKLFTRRVFDGADEEGSSEVSAFIGVAIDPSTPSDVPDEFKKHELIAGKPAWPVRLAFFKPKGQMAEPEYEMDMMLQANGVARSMTIDYTDFSVKGTLVKVEPYEPVSCPTEK